MRKKKIIDVESAYVPSLKQDAPLPISPDVAKSEEELEKIAPVENNKALKTKTPSKNLMFAILFVVVNLLAIITTALIEFAGDEQPVPLSRVWGVFMDNWGWGVGALAMYVLCVLFQSVKRNALLRSTLNKRFPIIGMNATILCKYYDNITPLGSGGQPFEVFYLRKKGIPVGVASGIPIVSYALDRIAYVIVAFIALIAYGFGETSIVIIILCVLGLVVNAFIPFAIFFFTVMPKVGSAIANMVAKIAKALHLTKDAEAFKHKLTDNIIEYSECLKFFMKKSKMCMFWGFVLSIMYFVALYSIPFFIVRMSGNAGADWFELLTLCVICYTSVTLLPTPGNSGGAELSFRSVFASFLSGGVLFWGMLAWRLVSYYLSIMVGLVLIICQQLYKFTERSKIERANNIAAFAKKNAFSQSDDETEPVKAQTGDKSEQANGVAVDDEELYTAVVKSAPVVTIEIEENGEDVHTSEAVIVHEPTKEEITEALSEKDAEPVMAFETVISPKGKDPASEKAAAGTDSAEKTDDKTDDNK